MPCKPTDPCYIYQGQLRTMSPSIVTVGSITVDISTSSGPQLMQRTRGEAAIRAYDVLNKVNPFTKIPFLRPYIYGLNLLTYGLIVVDPLDRLE
jgi:hypothetical protein